MPVIRRETKNISKFDPIENKNEPFISQRLTMEPTAPVIPIELYEEYKYYQQNKIFVSKGTDIFIKNETKKIENENKDLIDKIDQIKGTHDVLISKINELYIIREKIKTDMKNDTIIFQEKYKYYKTTSCSRY